MVWVFHGFGGGCVVPRMMISPSSAVISMPGMMRMSGYGLASSRRIGYALHVLWSVMAMAFVVGCLLSFSTMVLGWFVASGE